MQYVFLTSPFTFVSLFSAEGQSCGPEARALRGKSTGGRRIIVSGPIVYTQDEAGHLGARSREERDAPTTG